MSALDAEVAEPGRKALACIDRILADKPRRDGAAMTEATKDLCLFRDGLIPSAQAGDEAARRLEVANGVLSVVTAFHFPLGPAPWEELGKARGWLADLLGEGGPQSGGSPRASD